MGTDWQGGREGDGEALIAKLEFNLDNADDREAHAIAVKAQDWYITVHEFDQWLRGLTKYGEGGPVHSQDVRDKLHEIMADNGVSLE